LHMAQRMPLPLTVSCFSKIQIGFTFLVPAHLGSPGKMGVCVCALTLILTNNNMPAICDLRLRFVILLTDTWRIKRCIIIIKTDSTDVVSVSHITCATNVLILYVT